MSWHLEVCGTKTDVIAAIDESVSTSGGMPPVVGAYLKDAVAAVKTEGTPGMVVHVKSIGHRPIESSGAQEECVVRAIRRGPWTPPA